MGGIKEELGNRYHSLTVLSRAENGEKGQAYWWCRCDCGNVTKVLGSNLRKGNTKSCGCLQKTIASKVNTGHGFTSHPVYKVWSNMMTRCKNHKNNRYGRYGGRGIEICEEWEDVGVFIKWAEENGWEKSKQLDRIDNDKDYTPENCRFVTSKENNHNRPPIRENNKSGYAGVWYNGSLYQAYISGVDIQPGNKRVYLGSFESARDAVIARDKYIIEHSLPHRTQVLEKESI